MKAMQNNPLMPPGTDSMMTELIAKASPAFPADAIKVGDTWVQANREFARSMEVRARVTT